MPKPAVNSGNQIEADRALDTLRSSQKLIHLGRMAASIAHEVNNPLESITNLLYLLRSEAELSQDSLAYLDLAERELERVVTITRQTLNFARETKEPTEVSIHDLLHEVLLLYRHHIEEKQIHIVHRHTPTEPIRVFPGEIRQVLANLIVNAIEACGCEGSLALRLRPASIAGPTPGIRITIADDGDGIPPEVRHRLGEAFFTTKGQAGTGLGLWVSHSILKRYGGRLRLHSLHVSESGGQDRHGTVFTLFLPLTAEHTHSDPKPGSNPGSGPVLVERTAAPSQQDQNRSPRRIANQS